MTDFVRDENWSLRQSYADAEAQADALDARFGSLWQGKIFHLDNWTPEEDDREENYMVWVTCMTSHCPEGSFREIEVRGPRHKDALRLVDAAFATDVEEEGWTLVVQDWSVDGRDYLWWYCPEHGAWVE